MKLKLDLGSKIVIKLGSSTILNHNYSIKTEWLKSFAKDVELLLRQDVKIVIVSSGSIAFGAKFMEKSSKRFMNVYEQQAAASIGQPLIMQEYIKYLGKVGQVLVTLEDFSDRKRYLSLQNTLLQLMSKNFIPIINENDAVTMDEVRFGDNDRVAAKIAQTISADYLLLLSDIDGLYTKNPKIYEDAEFISEINNINSNIESMAGENVSSISSGGMITKIKAAKIAGTFGCNTIISNGANLNPISKIMTGECKFTIFRAEDNPLNAKKTWIVSDIKNIKAEVIIDDGAKNAILNSKSLLPIGVKFIKGIYEEGDSVIIKDLHENKIAIGIIAYNSSDSLKIIGKKTTEMARALEYNGPNYLIHADNIALYKTK